MWLRPPDSIFYPSNLPAEDQKVLHDLPHRLGAGKAGVNSI